MSTSQPSPTPVLQLIESFRWSQALFTAVEMGVFDVLSMRPMPAKDLAQSLSADPRAMELLLDSLICLQLLEKEADIYSVTPTAEQYCTRHSPQTLAGYIIYSRRVLWKLWDRMPNAIREGTHRWNDAFGMQGPIFSHFFDTPESMRTFLKGMHGFGQLASPLIVEAFDLTSFQSLCDVGGGTGHLAAAAKQRWPHLDVSVFDLPHVIAVLPEFSLGVRGISGNFFKDPIPKADLYCLCRILHDWDEKSCQALLISLWKALPKGGGIIIGEAILAEDHCGPSHAVFQSLNMLTCTEGKERSLVEYRQLLESVGFADVEAKYTGAPVDAIFARKP